MLYSSYSIRIQGACIAFNIYIWAIPTLGEQIDMEYIHTEH